VRVTNWKVREGPLLRALADHIDAEGPGVDPHRVADAIGMSHADVDRAADRLHRAEMLLALRGDGRVISVRDLTEKGLRAAQVWPPHADAEQMAQMLLAALDEAAEAESDEGTRSKLEAARAMLGSASVNAIGGVAAAAFAKVAGLA